MRLVIGRIGRPHGLRGELTLQVRTDSPERRFAPGIRLDTEPAERGPLEITSVREHTGRLLVCFAGVEDRTAAEALRDTLIAVDSSTSPPLDAEEYWDHELIGLRAVTVAGAALGEVTDVLHPPGSDLVVVRRPDGGELLLPFVAAIVPEVDIAAGRIQVNPPEGLLEL